MTNTKKDDLRADAAPLITAITVAATKLNKGAAPGKATLVLIEAVSIVVVSSVIVFIGESAMDTVNSLFTMVGGLFGG